LIIEVDNSFSEASSLHFPNDYYTYGGMIRSVIMEGISDLFIERIQFTPSIQGELACRYSDYRAINQLSFMFIQLIFQGGIELL
jgi:uncharacterized membrane protein YeiH